MMKYEFKVDVNVYQSTSYPVAVYRRQLRLFDRWKHVESYRTQREAIEAVAGMLKDLRDLPKYF